MALRTFKPWQTEPVAHYRIVPIVAAAIASGIAGIVSAVGGGIASGVQSKKARDESAREFDSEQAWQKEQFGTQMDFANRQLSEQSRIADQNFALAQQQFDYQKELNQTQMDREDNAMQRKLADYTAAGFSPLAALEGVTGGDSSPLTSADAPQYDGSGIASAAGQYIQTAQQYAALHMSAYAKNADRKTQLESQRQGARFALQQMIQQSISQGTSLALQAKNARINNAYTQEQLDYLRDKHDWENDHGYRNESLMQQILPALVGALTGKNVDGAVSSGADKVKSGVEFFTDAVKGTSSPDKISSTFDKLRSAKSVHGLTEPRLQTLWRSSKRLRKEYGNDFGTFSNMFSTMLKKGKSSEWLDMIQSNFFD